MKRYLVPKNDHQGFTAHLLDLHQQMGKAIVVEGIPPVLAPPTLTGSPRQRLDALAAAYDFSWEESNGAFVLTQQFKTGENSPELSPEEVLASLRDIVKLGKALGIRPAEESLVSFLQGLVSSLPPDLQRQIAADALPLRQLSAAHYQQLEIFLFQQDFASLLLKAEQLETTLRFLPETTLTPHPPLLHLTAPVKPFQRAFALLPEASSPLRGSDWPKAHPSLFLWQPFLQHLRTIEGLQVAPELQGHPAFVIAKEPSLALLRVLARVNDWQLQRRGPKEILLRRPAVPRATRENLGPALFSTLPRGLRSFILGRYPDGTRDPIYPILPPSLGRLGTAVLTKCDRRLQTVRPVLVEAIRDGATLPVSALTPAQHSALTDLLLFDTLYQVSDSLLGMAVGHEISPKPDLLNATLSSSERGNCFEVRYPNGGGFTVRRGTYPHSTSPSPSPPSTTA